MLSSVGQQCWRVAGAVKTIAAGASRELATGKDGLSHGSASVVPQAHPFASLGAPTPGDRAKRLGRPTAFSDASLVARGGQRQIAGGVNRGWRRACGRSLSSKCLCRGAPAVRRRLVVGSTASENTRYGAGVNMRFSCHIYSSVHSLSTYLSTGPKGGFAAVGIADVKK